MKTSSAKAKGRRHQQNVRDTILAYNPDLAPEDVVSCPMGSHGMDIQLSAAARAVFPYSVECKAKASGFTPVYDAIKQAGTNGGTLTPMAVVKQDREKPLAVLYLDDLMKLLASKS